jgi:hypothetical protein
LGFIPDFSVFLQEESGREHSGIEIGKHFRFYLAVTPTLQADTTVFCSELGDHEMKKSLDTKPANFCAGRGQHSPAREIGSLRLTVSVADGPGIGQS